MTQTAIEFIGVSFLLKLVAGWGLVTLLVSLAITTWQRITGQQTGWHATARNRRAAIVWHYPPSSGE